MFLPKRFSAEILNICHLCWSNSTNIFSHREDLHYQQ